MPPEAFRRAAFSIDMQTRLDPADAEDALLRCGYSRAVQVEGPGQFSRRGGILDFFSPAHLQPVRVEFWGDEIDSISCFDTGQPAPDGGPLRMHRPARGGDAALALQGRGLGPGRGA